MKNILRITLITIGAVICFYSLYNTYVIVKTMNTTHQSCGKIFRKVNDEVPVKHGTRTEFLFIMDWEDGKRSDVEVTPSTYFSHAAGNRICFTFNNEPDMNMNFFEVVMGIIGVIILIILIIIGIAHVCEFVVWVFKSNE